MKEITVSINSILLDVENPRINPVREQAEAIKELMEKVGDSKLFSLAADIIKNGVNPSDITMCVEYLTDKGKKVYIAKEGNRRLLALKGIAKPRIFNNAKWSSRMERLIYQAGGIGQAPKRIRVQIYSDDERAIMDHWIEIKHNGENGGAGTVAWGSSEKSRFFSRGKNVNVTMAIMDWLRNDTNVSDEDREKIKSVPTTTLARIVSSVPGRTILGVGIRDGHLQVSRKIERVRDDILSVIRDLTTSSSENPRRKIINVSDVKNIGQIQDYLAKKFPITTDSDKLPRPVQITIGQDSNAVSVSNVLPTRKTTSAKAQIGSQMHLNKRLRLISGVTSNEKIKKLVVELCSFKIVNVPLSFCIVFRSLLDVSMIHFSHKNGIATDNGKGKTFKYTEIAENCKNKIVTFSSWNKGQPLAWIKEAIRILNTDTLFSITELNNLVHGTMQVPSSENILTYVPRLVPFLIALNGGNPPTEG